MGCSAKARGRERHRSKLGFQGRRLAGSVIVGTRNLPASGASDSEIRVGIVATS
jgi:hypothetical protein